MWPPTVLQRITDFTATERHCNDLRKSVQWLGHQPGTGDVCTSDTSAIPTAQPSVEQLQ